MVGCKLRRGLRPQAEGPSAPLFFLTGANSESASPLRKLCGDQNFIRVEIKTSSAWRSENGWVEIKTSTAKILFIRSNHYFFTTDPPSVTNNIKTTDRLLGPAARQPTTTPRLLTASLARRHAHSYSYSYTYAYLLLLLPTHTYSYSYLLLPTPTPTYSYLLLRLLIRILLRLLLTASLARRHDPQRLKTTDRLLGPAARPPTTQDD
jgi:hypothetical protein